MPGNRYAFDDKNHVHTLDGKPLTGCSSVGDCLGKPGLPYWAAGKACEAMGWLHPRPKVNGKYVTTPTEARREAAGPVLEAIKAEGVDEYLARLDNAYKAHAGNLKKTAKAGTDLHAELESYVKGVMGLAPARLETDYAPQIQPYIAWSKENVRRYLWSEAHCYSERLWTGGISDAGAELMDNSHAVIDFKSSPQAYITGFIQAAGYAIGIEENGLFSSGGTHQKKLDGVRFNKLIIVPFGAAEVKPDIRPSEEYPVDVSLFKIGFEQAVGLYRLMGLNKKEA